MGDEVSINYSMATTDFVPFTSLLQQIDQGLKHVPFRNGYTSQVSLMKVSSRLKLGTLSTSVNNAHAL